MRFLRNTLSVLITSMIGVPLGLLTSIVLTRSVSVDDRGYYALAVTFAGALATLAQFGIGDACVYRVRRIGPPPERVATAGLVLVTAIGAAVCGLALSSQPWIVDRFLGSIPNFAYYVAVAWVPLQLLQVYFTNFARALDRFSWANYAAIATSVGTLTAFLVVLVGLQLGLPGALVAVVAVNGIAIGCLVAAILQETGCSLRIDLPEIKASLRFGMRSYLQGLAGQAHERVDVFMIAFFLHDPQQVGLYAIAVSTSLILKLIPESIGKGLLPKLAGMTDDDGAHLTAIANRHTLAWTTLGALGLVVAAPFLLPFLYGSEYRPSIPVAWVLIPATVFLTVYRVFSRYFTAIGRQRVNVLSQISSVFLNVGLNIWLIPTYGIVGAAIASLISYAYEALVVGAVFMRMSRIGFRRAFVFNSADVGEYRKRLVPLLSSRESGNA